MLEGPMLLIQPPEDDYAERLIRHLIAARDALDSADVPTEKRHVGHWEGELFVIAPVEFIETPPKVLCEVEQKPGRRRGQRRGRFGNGTY